MYRVYFVRRVYFAWSRLDSTDSMISLPSGQKPIAKKPHVVLDSTEFRPSQSILWQK
jgi:hypothetical protein